MGYKLLCTDIDGTLIDDEKKLSNKNLEAIKAACEKGIKVVVCTGRLFTSARYYANLIGIKAPIIASNGAYIRDKDSEEIIYKNVLSLNNCKEILSILRKNNMPIRFNTCDTILLQQESLKTEAYVNINKTLPDEWKINLKTIDNWESAFVKYENEIVKSIAICNDIEKIKACKKEMQQIEGITVVSSWPNNFEVVNKQVSKGRAVEILAAYYGIDKQDIICIGDNENDISMIEYAGLGVAMGNAEEAVKKASNFITDTNNEDGVAKVIEKFIL